MAFLQNNMGKMVAGKLAAGMLAAVLVGGMACAPVAKTTLVAEAADQSQDGDVMVYAQSQDEDVTVSAKALKKAKTNISIKVNGKSLKAKGFKVSAKIGNTKSVLVYVPVKQFAKALGATYTEEDGYSVVSTGEERISFESGQDEYAFSTEVEGMDGATGPISYGTSYKKGKALYIPATVFESFYGIFIGNDVKMQLEKKNFTFICTEKAEEGGQVQIPNPIHEQADLSSLSVAVGFDVAVPSALADYNAEYSDISGEVAQVIFEKDGKTLYYRMSEGTEDNSGVYEVYENVSTENIAGKDVTLKGNGESVALATWTDGSYSYSVYAESGISASEMENIVESVGTGK